MTEAYDQIKLHLSKIMNANDVEDLFLGVVLASVVVPRCNNVIVFHILNRNQRNA